jgi:NAD(P)-dependent dehydrogenase (short-subunit alcohol dehydrogenase family)
LFTGGSRGLGLQIAKGLGEMGARLAICARKAEELLLAEAELSRLGIGVLGIPHDLSQLDRMEALLGPIAERYSAPDLLVNNAGASWGARAEDHSLEALEQGDDV